MLNTARQSARPQLFSLIMDAISQAPYGYNESAVPANISLKCSEIAAALVALLKANKNVINSRTTSAVGDEAQTFFGNS